VFASPVSPPAVDGVQPERWKGRYGRTLRSRAMRWAMMTQSWRWEGRGSATGKRKTSVQTFIHKPLSKLASSSSSIPFSPISAACTREATSSPTLVSQPYGTRPNEQIHITSFTLVRFTNSRRRLFHCLVPTYPTRTRRVTCEPAPSWLAVAVQSAACWRLSAVQVGFWC